MYILSYFFQIIHVFKLTLFDDYYVIQNIFAEQKTSIKRRIIIRSHDFSV